MCYFHFNVSDYYFTVAIKSRKEQIINRLTYEDQRMATKSLLDWLNTGNGILSSLFKTAFSLGCSSMTYNDIFWMHSVRSSSSVYDVCKPSILSSLKILFTTFFFKKLPFQIYFSLKSNTGKLNISIVYDCTILNDIVTILVLL